MIPSRLALAALTTSLHAASVDAAVRFDLVRDDGAERCADGAEVQREVSRRLGSDPFGAAPDRFIDATLSRTHDTWTARVRIRDLAGDPLGARTLTSDAPTCGPLTEALSLALVLLIDPTADLASPPPPPPPATPPPPDPAPPASAPPAPAPRAPRRGVVFVGLRALASWGVVPSVSPGVALRAEFALSRRWRARVEGRWLAESALTQAEVWRFGVTSAHAGVCVAPVAGDALALDVCAALAVGAMRVSIDGASTMRTGDHPWAAVEAGPRLRWRPARWIELDADVTAGAALVRRAFGVVGEPTARFEPGAVSLSAGVGAAVALP